MARKKSEEQKLVDFFRSEEGSLLGSQGDHDNLTPAETAIRAMQKLLVRWRQDRQLRQKRNARVHQLRKALSSSNRGARILANRYSENARRKTPRYR